MKTTSRLALHSLAVATTAVAAHSVGMLLHEPPEIHCRHFFWGYPSGSPTTNDLVIREAYALSNNDDTKFADWVAYAIDPSMVWDQTDPERKWRSDPWLEEDETLEAPDYKDASGDIDIDRGHQAPLASFKSTLYSRQTNFLSNITPQKKDLNQGPWKDLEESVRALVRTNREVWVVTGPLYEDTMEELPEADEDHQIPSGYWKIVAIGKRGKAAEFEATAFVMSQDTARNADFRDFIVSIDEVESRCDLDFFRNLPAHAESQVESIEGVWPLGQ